MLLLGFFGSRHTEHLGQQFLSGIVRVGVRLFVLYLVIGLGISLQGQFLTVLTAAAQQGPPDIGTYFGVLAGSAVFALMAWRIPDLALSMLSGSAAIGLGSSAGTALLGASIARAVTAGIVRAQHVTSATQRTNESMGKLDASAKAGTGERKSTVPGVDLPTSQPHQGGLNTVTPPASSRAGGSGERKSAVPGVELPIIQPHQGGLNAVTPPASSRAGGKPWPGEPS